MREARNSRVRLSSGLLRSNDAATVLPAFLTIFYVLGATWSFRSYAMDDAYIGFHYVSNLIAGNGLVFEPGTRVEGVTNIAWLLLISPLSTVLPPHVVAKAFALVFVSMTAWTLLSFLHRVFSQDKPAPSDYAIVPGLSIILVVTNADFMAFSMLGMETAFLAAVLAAMVCLPTTHRSPITLAALGSLAFLIHPEAVLVLPLTLVIAGLSRAMTRQACTRCLLTSVLLIATATAARMLYFGAPVPNTFYAKPSTGDTIFGHLLLYTTGRFANVSEPFSTILALIPLAVGYSAVARVAPVNAAVAAATCATGLLFSLYAAPDWTERGRYFAPYIPVAMALMCVGIVAIAQQFTANRKAANRAAVALLSVVALSGFLDTWYIVSDQARSKYPGYVMTSRSLIEPATWIRDNIPPGTTIATRRVGVLAYYGMHRIFDYTFGLSDRQVGQLIHRYKRHFEDPHDPALAGLWRERAPEYLLEDGRVIDGIAGRTGSRSSFSIHGLQYQVVKAFKIAEDTEWTLAQRITP